MNSEPGHDLKIEGAMFPALMDPAVRSRVNQVQGVALVVGLAAWRSPLTGRLCSGISCSFLPIFSPMSSGSGYLLGAS